MRNNLYLVVCLLFIAAFAQPTTTTAQSWSYSTSIFNNDTVGDQSTACINDNQGNSYWVSHYYVANTGKYGYWLWKIDRGGGFYSTKVIELNSPALIIKPVIKLYVFSGALYVQMDVKKALSPFDTDICIQKYDVNLTKKWEAIYSAGGVTDENGVLMTDGPNSSVLVALTSGKNSRVLSYAKSNGQLLNSLLYNNSTNEVETINSMLYDGGIIYIGGRNSVNAPNNVNMFIAKYDANFVQQWNKIYDASNTLQFDELTHMSIDANNDVVITGNFTSSTGTNRVFFAKYNDSNGSRLWIRRITNDFVHSTAVYTNSSNNVISVITGEPGRFVSINTTNGALLASKGIFNSPSVNCTILKTLKGTSDDLYVLANYDSAYTTNGITTIESGTIVSKISPNGSREWTNKTVSTDLSQSYAANDICFRSPGRLFFNCNIFNPANAPKKTYCYYTSISAYSGLRLDDGEVSEKELAIYPNPAHSSVQLKFADAAEGLAVVRIYALDGRLVQEENLSLYQGEQLYTLSLEKLQTGMYLLQLQQGEKRWSERLVKD